MRPAHVRGIARGPACAIVGPIGLLAPPEETFLFSLSTFEPWRGDGHVTRRRANDQRDAGRGLPTQLPQRRGGGRCSGVLGRLPVPQQPAGLRPGRARGQRRAAADAHRQRPEPARGRRAAGNPGDDAPLQAGSDRHEAGVRPRGVRRLHRPRGRRAALLVLGADALGALQEDPDHRRPAGGRRHAASGAAGRPGGTRLPVRLLHVGLHHGHGRLFEEAPEPRPARSWRTGCPAICAAARTTTRS